MKLSGLKGIPKEEIANAKGMACSRHIKEVSMLEKSEPERE